MKLIECSGRELTIRDLGPPLMRFRARGMPIRYDGPRIVEDDAAREVARELIASGLYDREKVG